MTFKFNITLTEITQPPVWRKLLVPEDFTFYRMHHVIQVAFGWKGAHLFQFSPGRSSRPPIIALADQVLIDEDEFLDCKKTRLNNIFTAPQQNFSYLYDFGDGWYHVMTLEEIRDQPMTNADCIDGWGACPPEDCGGPDGYHELKLIMKSPGSPEYNEMHEWLRLPKGQTWNADRFDLANAKMAVQKI
jgi:hypothetical protein